MLQRGKRAFRAQDGAKDAGKRPGKKAAGGKVAPFRPPALR